VEAAAEVPAAPQIAIPTEVPAVVAVVAAAAVLVQPEEHRVVVRSPCISGIPTQLSNLLLWLPVMVVLVAAVAREVPEAAVALAVQEVLARTIAEPEVQAAQAVMVAVAVMAAAALEVHQLAY
jgi:hypothetical protein